MSAALLLAPALATAQVGLAGSLRVDGGLTWVRSEAAAGSTLWRGGALWGEGQIAVGPVLLGADLLEGRVQAAAGGAPRRYLVDGALFGGVRLASWLEVVAANRVRVYLAGGKTERWVLWEARARAAGPVVARSVWSYVELRRAWSATVNGAGAGEVQGGEAGLVLWPGSPLSFRLSYRIDEARLAPGTREVLEALGVGVAITTP